MSNLEIANYIIYNKKIPREFNDDVIVQIRDLHNRSFGKNNIRLINEIDKILSRKYNAYYITGNHEQKALVKKYKHLYKEYFTQISQLPVNLPKINNNEYNILLAHTPFYFEEYEKWRADLILSSHVHGV